MNTVSFNALTNPFNVGDTIVVPADFEAVLLSPGVPKPLSLEETATAEVTNATQPRHTTYRNGEKDLFMPTVAFRLNGREYDGYLTVELLKANNINPNIKIYS